MHVGWRSSQTKFSPYRCGRPSSVAARSVHHRVDGRITLSNVDIGLEFWQNFAAELRRLMLNHESKLRRGLRSDQVVRRHAVLRENPLERGVQLAIRLCPRASVGARAEPHRLIAGIQMRDVVAERGIGWSPARGGCPDTILFRAGSASTSRHRPGARVSRQPPVVSRAATCVPRVPTSRTPASRTCTNLRRPLGRRSAVHVGRTASARQRQPFCARPRRHR